MAEAFAPRVTASFTQNLRSDSGGRLSSDERQQGASGDKRSYRRESSNGERLQGVITIVREFIERAETEREARLQRGELTHPRKVGIR